LKRSEDALASLLTAPPIAALALTLRYYYV